MKVRRARAERIIGQSDTVRVTIDRIQFTLTQDEFNCLAQDVINVLNSVAREQGGTGWPIQVGVQNCTDENS